MELFSPGHLIVLLAVVGITFFGWRQLPDMARSAGRSLRVFRTELGGLTDSVTEAHAVATDGISKDPHTVTVVSTGTAERPASE